VAIHGSRTVPEVTQQMLSKVGANHFAVVGDVSDASVCSLLIEQVVHHFGAIDILVNNAGTIRRSPALERSEEDWQAVIDTNLSSVFRLTKQAGKHMLAQGSGKVINIASVVTFQGGVFVPSHAAAKGGVGQLTKAFADEWAAKGVNVNAIAPGYMATDNTEALRKNPERSRQILERIPAGRWGCTDDLAGGSRVSCVQRQRLCAWSRVGRRWWVVEPLIFEIDNDFSRSISEVIHETGNCIPGPCRVRGSVRRCTNAHGRSPDAKSVD
jgi:2-deoxy-D-gluconate 3-dehydrogenase